MTRLALAGRADVDRRSRPAFPPMTRRTGGEGPRTMNTDPTCPVCGHTLTPDGEHVEVETKIDPREERGETYYLHSRCAGAVFGGWEK